MKILSFWLCILSSCVAFSAETVLDFDFTACGYRQVNARKKGECLGELPVGVQDNFSGWSEGRARLARREEDGVAFFNIVSDAQNGPVQFSIACPKLETPAFFRLSVKGRVRGGSLGLQLRLSPSPYTSLALHSFSSPDWDVKTYVFPVTKPCKGPIALYLHTGNGETDLQRITLEKIERAELARTIRRPPAAQNVFLSERFLLGLPNGWNDDRHTETATVTPVSDPASPKPALRLDSCADEEMALWSAPFQTGDPSRPLVVNVRYRARGSWKVSVTTDNRSIVKTHALDAASSWQTARFTFKPSDLAVAFALKFSGTGELLLDALSVCKEGSDPNAPQDAPACALACEGGEIAGLTRIFFTDEKPSFAWAVAHAPARARLKIAGRDLYGRRTDIAEIPLEGGAYEKGRYDLSAYLGDRTGQFCLTARIVAEGRDAHACDELIVTRIPRPLGWKRDMPDSPFGIHMEPRPGTLATLKACGVNWTRFHDAASRLTGWYALESEKDKWTFYDASVKRFREHHIKIFAQLGTAPAWATHYRDLGCKRMGYFEKYLRPVDTNAWLRYVTRVVKRYEKEIDAYFFWNEPWGRWWKSADDIKYYDASRAAEDFGAWQALTYKAVKAVNPRIFFAGFNSYASSLGAAWTKGVDDGGGWEACDALDYHVYTPNLRALRKDADYPLLAFKPLYEKYPCLAGKPVIMSEGQGTSSGGDSSNAPMSGLYEARIPWEAETSAALALRADATCRYTLSLLAAGDARIFLYGAHGYRSLVSPPRFTVLVGADGYPDPSLAAYAFFTRTLETRKFISKGPAGESGCVYTFGRACGGRSCVKLYTGLSRAEAEALHAHSPLRDLYGNVFDGAHWFAGSLLYAHGQAADGQMW